MDYFNGVPQTNITNQDKLLLFLGAHSQQHLFRYRMACFLSLPRTTNFRLRDVGIITGQPLEANLFYFKKRVYCFLPH